MGKSPTSTANTSPASPSEEKAAATRIDIRNKIFAAKPETVIIDFFDTKIELRQPTLGLILDARQNNLEDASTQMLMQYAFVPVYDDSGNIIPGAGEEKIFEEADEEIIRQIPFGPDMQRLTQAVNKLLGVDAEGLDALVSAAKKRPGDGTASSDDDEDSMGAGEGSD